ncbi:Major facilitator superfamily protein [Prunus dulcis]|uniref:Major facilitator superfamily protein n=1 Tax=Prunus dulcis TaxID=3755 RepID=A0A4Y1QN17_PRUDU|nr:Major facilitator superfamily protein [Prunus dulcis]
MVVLREKHILAMEQGKDVERGETSSNQEELEQPFIRRRKVVAHEDDGSGKEFQNESIGMVLLSTGVAVCGSFQFGVGYSAPTQSAIRKDLNLSLAEYSTFGSILSIGAVLGAITSGKIADFLGRKGAMRVSSVICIVAWLAIYFSQGALSLDTGRFLTGYGIAAFSYVVPVFIAEIAPKNLRGGLATLNQAKVGRDKEFEVALQTLRGNNADISDEMTEIQVSAAGMFVGCMLAGTSFSLKGQGLLLDWVPIIAVSGVLIFPIDIKGVGGSLVVLVNWSGAWIVSYTYNFLMRWSSPGTYFLYSAVCLLTILFVAKIVPETKGKTLEEIQASLNPDRRQSIRTNNL